jgi:hyperosmotically inducible periplasmic protein
MSLVKRNVLAIIILAAVLVLTHCRQESSSEKISVTTNQLIEDADKETKKAKGAVEIKVEGAAATVDDATITALIKAEILGDPLLKIGSIAVTTNGGVVRLQGGVNSQKSVDRAEELAGSIENVKSVDNRLAVIGY